MDEAGGRRWRDWGVIVTALLRGAPPSSGGALRLLLLGIGAYVVADVADGCMSLHGAEAVNLRWTHLLWLGGLLLFAAAAERQWAHAGGEAAAEEPERPRRAFSVRPYLAVAGGYGLLLVARGLALYPLGGMLVGSVVMIAVDEAVTGEPVQAGGEVLALTLSLGVAGSDGCRGLDALLHRADMALYQAKRRGRDQAAVWSGANRGVRGRR